MYSILIAEDEDIIRMGLRTIIQKFDLPIGDIYETSTGKQAEELCISHQPDIILTDIVMPDLSGLDFIANIKNKQITQSEIVVISGYDDFKYAQNAMRLGVSNYLLKPVKREQLYEALQEMIERVSQKRGSEQQLPDVSIDGIIDHALKYIHENISEPLNLETMSKKLLINPNYFSHLFKKETNENFVIYLQKIRVEYAKKLLADPLLRIYQISDMVGFNNEKYFYKVFKKYAKFTPNQYRKMALRNKD